MSHIGVLSYKGVGHLNPLAALSQELCATWGHRITFFGSPELEDRVRSHGVEFYAVGDGGGAARAAHDNYHDHLFSEVEGSLRELPAAIRKAGVDALMVDEIILAGPTLAEMMGLPYCMVSTSIPHGFGWHVPKHLSVPKCVASDDILSADGYSKELGFLDEPISDASDPITERLDAFRKSAGLGPLREMQRVFPPLVHVAQLPQCLDFRRSSLPANFYYAGPFVSASTRSPVEFPWDRLDGRPVVYASLGTARKVEADVFGLIAEACYEQSMQVVISLGGRGEPMLLGDLPGHPLVVKDAPQLELLKMASAVITHGGLNTVLEALLEGLPMVVIPLAYDQPAVAARLTWLGAAEMIAPDTLSASRIAAALKRVIEERSYRSVALDLQARIRSACGLERAAALIDAALPAAVASSR